MVCRLGSISIGEVLKSAHWGAKLNLIHIERTGNAY